ncbi:MAG: transcriptional repressor LexA [Candidatus Lernaella stagnicola]|nr:transcriptional repressor LexA [Candidatus Lernaella stagnicola]
MAHTPPGKTREKVFRFVRERILNSRPPSVREVQEALGFAAYESARRHLENLVAEGRLAKEPGQSRPYRLPGDDRREATFLIPLLGQVQAGDWTAAIEQPEGYLPLSSRAPQDSLFALRVRGESMKNAGILEGDIAVVRRQPTAESGEIVVALVAEDATVKRLRLRRGRVELHPENEAFPVIVPNPEELAILGKVIEVRRYLEDEPLVEVSA